MKLWALALLADSDQLVLCKCRMIIVHQPLVEAMPGQLSQPSPARRKKLAQDCVQCAHEVLEHIPKLDSFWIVQRMGSKSLCVWVMVLQAEVGPSF